MDTKTFTLFTEVPKCTHRSALHDIQNNLYSVDQADKSNQCPEELMDAFPSLVDYTHDEEADGELYDGGCGYH